MPVQDLKPSLRETAQFEHRAVEVLQHLRAAFLHLMDSLPSPTSKAADLDKALGVSRTLGWQIHSVATSTTPLEAGVNVPGMSAVQRALRAARNAGTPNDVLKEVANAMRAFEALVDEHAGDRATFNAMINSLAAHDEEAINLKMRRQAFRANSEVWGVQVKTSLACELFHPGKSSDFYEIVSIRGLRGIRRLRTGAPFRLMTQHFIDERKDPVQPQSIGAKSVASHPGPNLLHDFCTQPTPKLENRIEGQRLHTYIRDIPLGNAGVQTLYLADVTRDIDWKSPPGEQNVHTRFSAIMKPIESLVLDTLIHKDMFSTIGWELAIYGSLDRLGEIDPGRFLPEDKLPIKAELRDLGVGPSALPTPHVPRYREMVESVCRDVGWNPHDFRLYRCVVEYPMVSSVIAVKFLLPESGTW